MAKVGSLNEENQKEVVKGRQDYSSAELVVANPEAVDPNGLLSVCPDDFNCRKNNPLKKEAFVSEAIYIRYQSLVASQRAEFYAKKSGELTAKADRLEKFGSEAARKAAGKLARAKTQMATLRKQLLDSGMGEEELDALIKNM